MDVLRFTADVKRSCRRRLHAESQLERFDPCLEPRILGTGLLVATVERGQQVDWFSSDWIVFGLVIAVVALISLVISELRADEPVINFRLAQSRQAAACSRR